jgi:transposase
MIPRGVEVFVGLDPVDLRWSFDRLGGVVLDRLGRDARSGALFVFFGKRRSALKVFFADGSGLCVFYKRLDKGVFRLPMPLDERATSVVIDERALDDLLDGIDVDPVRPRPPRRERVH